jgi:putative aldouronate transport system substrate-binding protein
MKKTVHFAMILLLVAAGTIFASGAGQDKAGGEKPSLLIGIQTSPVVTNYKNNFLTRYLEKLHNINLEFYQLPSNAAEVRTKVSLMVASNDLTDIIMTSFLSNEAILEYGRNKVFVPLNKYYKDPAKSPNFHAIPANDRAYFLKSLPSADGNIYSLFSYTATPWNEAFYRYYFNKAWLDKLGLKMPATTGELRDVLIAFRDKDPNGNGKKDEIGIYGFFSGGYGESPVDALLNSFIFYRKDRLELDASGTKVIAPFIDSAFRKGLVYLNTLFKDRVLAASLFTDDQQRYRATLSSVPHVVGLTTAGSLSEWVNADTSPNFRELAFVPPFTGPDGICYTPYTPVAPTPIGFITSRCKDPDMAFKFLEYFLNRDMTLVSRYGEEGVDWSRKPEDLTGKHNAYIDKGIAGKPSLVEISRIWSEPSNKYWRAINPLYLPMEISFGLVGPVTDPSRPSYLIPAQQYQWYMDKHPRHILPVLKYNLEEAVKISEPVTSINDYVRQSIAEFVVGTKDINSDAAWNMYVQELNKMGLQRWLSAAQAAYDRQK